MTSATTIYRDFLLASFEASADDCNSTERRREAARDKLLRPNFRQAQDPALGPKSTTVLGQFSMLLDVDSMSTSVIPAEAQFEFEIPLFVPYKPKSARRVRFHVKSRSAWQPNPILPDQGE